MTAALTEHLLPWTEEEYRELGETPDRMELFDGSLVVSPSPTPEHQELSFRLAAAFRRPASAVGLRVYLAVNVRLKHDRIPIPELVIVSDIDPREPVIDASSVRLIGEILSPSTASTDNVLKMHYYAEAGIPWYLIVDPREMALSLFQLEGDQYIAHADASPGQPLRMSEPVELSLDPAALEY